jgi:hypothetical protein
MKRCTFNNFIFVTAVLLMAGSAFAQTIRPGLWQVNNKLRSANAETDQVMAVLLGQMANLPPQQRKMVQDMAASQGVSMPEFGADGTIGLNACVTPDMAARRQIPLGQPGDCRSDNVAIPGGMKISFTCANPSSSGEGKLSFIGDTGFTMTMNVTTSARGKPEQASVDSTGKWLGATCPAR